MSIASQVRESLIGKRVMLRSNEDEPLKLGTLIRFEEFANFFLPVVGLDSGEEVTVMSLILPYDEKLRGFLEGMTNKEQYELLKKMFMLYNDIESSRK